MTEVVRIKRGPQGEILCAWCGREFLSKHGVWAHYGLRHHTVPRGGRGPKVKSLRR